MQAARPFKVRGAVLRVADQQGVLVASPGVGDGGQDEVEVLAIDSCRQVGHVDQPIGGGVDQRDHDVEHTSLPTGQHREMLAEPVAVQPDASFELGHDPRLVCSGESPTERAQQ